MRITQSTLARLGLAQLNDQRSRLARTQEQAATGLRINRPSDDPVDYRKVLSLKDASSQTSTYLRSIDLARVRLRATESALDGAEEVMSRARATAVEAASSTNQGSDAAAALKTEVAQIFDELLSYANVKAPGGGYVFSGLDSDTEAFTRTGDFGSGVTPTVTFTGEASAIEVEIDEGVLIEVTRDGQAAFQGANDAFAALSRLWTGIDQGDVDEVRGAMADIESSRAHLTQERAILGGSDAKAASFEDRLRLQEQNIATQVSFLEDADAFEVYSSLTAQETALQAALQVNARLLQPTLLDYI